MEEENKTQEFDNKQEEELNVNVEDDEIVNEVLKQTAPSKKLTKKQLYRLHKKEQKEKKEFEKYRFERIEREKTLSKYMAEFDPVALRKAEKENNWAYIIQKNLDSIKRDEEERNERLSKSVPRPITEREVKEFQWSRNYNRPLEVVYNQYTAGKLLRFYR